MGFMGTKNRRVNWIIKIFFLNLNVITFSVFSKFSVWSAFIKYIDLYNLVISPRAVLMRTCVGKQACDRCDDFVPLVL